jgi:hypothetical protein
MPALLNNTSNLSSLARNSLADFLIVERSSRSRFRYAMVPLASGELDLIDVIALVAFSSERAAT